MTGAPLRRAGEELEGRDGDRALGGLCRRGPAQTGLQRCTADRERSKVCAGKSPSVGRSLMEAEGVRFASKLGFSLVANRNPLLVHKVLATLRDQGLPQKQGRFARWLQSGRCSEGHERGCRDVSRTGEDGAAVAASANRVRSVCYGECERGAAAGAASAKGVVEVVCGHVGR